MIPNSDHRSQLRAQGRDTQKTTGQLDYPAVLGDGLGNVTVPGADYIYYVRTVMSEINGVTEYGTPEPALASGANIVEESGFPVIVSYDRGVPIILRPDSIEMYRRGNNPAILNPHNPYNKFVFMPNATIGYVERVGTGNTPTMEVWIKPFYYIDADGVYQVAGNQQFDFTPYIPTVDGNGNNQHLIAGLFVNRSNTIVAVVSTAKVLENNLTHGGDLAEVFINAPARAMPLRAFKLYTGQTLVEDTDTFSDTRGWLNTIYRKNNYSAVVAPTVNDDIDLNYEEGSWWFDVAHDKIAACVDETDGAAIWRSVGSGVDDFVNIDDTDSPYAAGVKPIIYANTSGGDITVTLPTVASNGGNWYTIKNTGTGTVTIDPAGTETIDKDTTLIVNAQYDAPKIHCDGADWWII